jgi:hypothetical protein
MVELSLEDVRNEITSLERKRSKACWYNPASKIEKGDNGINVLPKTIYLGEENGGPIGKVPTWNDPVMNSALFKKNFDLYKSGAITDVYAIKEDPYIGDWKKIAREYADLITGAIKSGSMSKLKGGGIGFTSDFSAIDIVNVQNEVVNTELRAFVLEEAVTTVATPSLLLKVDSWTRFTGQRNIGEGVPPTLKLGSVSRTSFDLPKDGSAIALSFEAQTRASHDLYRTHVENAISDLRRIKANKIATELETATDSAAGDWAAYTTDHSTRVPYDDIGVITDLIVANNGNADTIATHDRVWRDFIANTHFKGLGDNPAHNGPFSVARAITGITGLESFTWYIDNEKTNTLATIYQKAAVYKMQGPVRTAVVRQELEDVDAYRIFDFNLPKIIISGRIRDLTGVSA